MGCGGCFEKDEKIKQLEEMVKNLQASCEIWEKKYQTDEIILACAERIVGRSVIMDRYSRDYLERGEHDE
jgi:hypothetical protein